MDTLICATDDFLVKTPAVPHVPREDGGHIFVEARDKSIEDRTMLTPSQIVECSWLTTLAGQALEELMESIGIPLYRINYQDNGNWSFVRKEKPLFHVHIYGRAQAEEHQRYGQALHLPYPTTGFYEGFEPLNESDAGFLRERMVQLSDPAEHAWEISMRLDAERLRFP